MDNVQLKKRHSRRGQRGRFVKAEPQPIPWLSIIAFACVCAVGLVLAFSKAQQQPVVMFGAPKNESPYYPPQPYVPPSYNADFIVTGEATRQQNGQLRMTLGFYPKGNGGGFFEPLRGEEAKLDVED